jgi:hypothetical protein
MRDALRRARVDLAEPCAKHDGFVLADEIPLADEQPIGESDLEAGLFSLIELPIRVLGVDAARVENVSPQRV